MSSKTDLALTEKLLASMLVAIIYVESKISLKKFWIY